MEDAVQIKLRVLETLTTLLEAVDMLADEIKGLAEDLQNED